MHVTLRKKGEWRPLPGYLTYFWRLGGRSESKWSCRERATGLEQQQGTDGAFCNTFTGDLAMASTSTSGANMMSDSEMSRLGGIEALRLRAGGPVRRSLFGPVDHEQLQRDFQRLLCVNMEVASQRWNFDFRRDMPGKGSHVEWEALRCQDVPVFYHSRTAARPAAKARRRASTSSSSSSSSDGEGSPVSSSSGSGEEYLEVTTRGCYRLKRPGKHRQSAITDFFAVKKRKLLHYKAPSRQ